MTNGIAKKKNELRAFITDNEIDVALLSETLFKPSHILNIPNYITYRTDENTKAGEGIAILVRKEIKHYPIGTNTAKMETTAVHISTKRDKKEKDTTDTQNTEEFANYLEGTFPPNPPVDMDHEIFTDVINKQAHAEYSHHKRPRNDDRGTPEHKNP
ncbi:hypothetical protein Trydic_g14058 [Trypoxylus dichotomus]